MQMISFRNLTNRNWQKNSQKYLLEWSFDLGNIHFTTFFSIIKDAFWNIYNEIYWNRRYHFVIRIWLKTTKLISKDLLKQKILVSNVVAATRPRRFHSFLLMLHIILSQKDNLKLTKYFESFSLIIIVKKTFWS